VVDAVLTITLVRSGEEFGSGGRLEACVWRFEQTLKLHRGDGKGHIWLALLVQVRIKGTHVAQYGPFPAVSDGRYKYSRRTRTASGSSMFHAATACRSA